MQAWIGSDKSFTYDFVYDTGARQEDVYEDTVKPLIEGCFEGQNYCNIGSPQWNCLCSQALVLAKGKNCV